MLKVHFVAGTRAGRIVWLLEELGLEYEVNSMPFTKDGLKSSEHRAQSTEHDTPWVGCRYLKMATSLFSNQAPSSNIFLRDMKMAA